MRIHPSFRRPSIIETFESLTRFVVLVIVGFILLELFPVVKALANCIIALLNSITVTLQ